MNGPQLKELNDNIGRVVRNILVRASHWGYMISAVPRRYSKEVDTACVFKQGLGVGMKFNPEFMSTLSEAEKTFVILHEIMHIAWAHPFLIYRYKNKDAFNIAADLEINQHVARVKGAEWPRIKEGPSKGDIGAVTLETFDLDPEVHAFKGVKWYYDYLMKNKKFHIDFPILTGSHKGWKDAFDGLSKSERQIIRGAVEGKLATALSADGNAVGKLPGDLRELFKSLINPKPVYNWKKMLRTIITGYATETYLKSTRRKESVRFKGMAGNKIRFTKSIMCGIDTSGSMCDDELIEGFTEVDGARKAGFSVTVVECDAGIDEQRGVWKYKNVNQLRNRNMITGGGGTSFEPVVKKYADDPQYSLLIYFTDGYAPPPQTKTNKPIIWVLSSQGMSLEEFKEQKIQGYVIKIIKEEENE